MKARGNQVVLPINVASIIEEGDPVFKMAEILGGLDYRKLRRTYKRRWRSISPEIMFSIVVFANMKGIYSSRGIEEACKTDIRFMWLLQYHKAPDHSTISRFLENNMSGCAEDLFYQLTEKLADKGEIDFEALFVDGTKIEANANRYSFVWAKAVEKRLNRLNEKVKKELPLINTKYGLSGGLGLERTAKELRSLADIQGISFVHGKGKHKTQLQRDCERLEELLNKGNEYVEHLRICGKRKSYSKTDPDATFMRMKEDHMRNGQLKPGYNLQIGVSGEYIVGLGLFPNPTDTTTLIPFLERMRSGLKRSFRDIVADMGYASEENYTYLESNSQNAYIKPSDHDVKKKRKFKSNIFHRDNMPYDEENDRFTCPNGKQLVHSYDSETKTDNGYPVKKSYYICESCAGCPYREQCFKGQYENRKIELSFLLSIFRFCLIGIPAVSACILSAGFFFLLRLAELNGARMEEYVLLDYARISADARNGFAQLRLLWRHAVKEELVHGSVYPNVDRERIGMPKREEQYAVRHLRADTLK